MEQGPGANSAENAEIRADAASPPSLKFSTGEWFVPAMIGRELYMLRPDYDGQDPDERIAGHKGKA